MATSRKATLLDLVQTVSSYAISDAEVVATVASLIDSGKVREENKRPSQESRGKEERSNGITERYTDLSDCSGLGRRNHLRVLRLRTSDERYSYGIN